MAGSGTGSTSLVVVVVVIVQPTPQLELVEVRAVVPDVPQPLFAVRRDPEVRVAEVVAGPSVRAPQPLVVELLPEQP